MGSKVLQNFVKLKLRLYKCASNQWCVLKERNAVSCLWMSGIDNSSGKANLFRWTLTTIHLNIRDAKCQNGICVHVNRRDLWTFVCSRFVSRCFLSCWRRPMLRRVTFTGYCVHLETSASDEVFGKKQINESDKNNEPLTNDCRLKKFIFSCTLLCSQ